LEGDDDLKKTIENVKSS